MSDGSPLHALAWVAWLAALAIALTYTRNPIYLGILLLWIAVVSAAVRLADLGHTLSLPLSPLRFALIAVPLAALFNGLNVHVGSYVLFRLPRGLPLIGGPITLEAIVYGVLNGLMLTGLFAAFSVINRALSVRSLVRLIPRAYQPLAVAVSIAVTFVPMVQRQLEEIRQAQAVRGHRLRGLRSYLPLMMPLLMGGLERALQLAEAMAARGFAGRARQDNALYRGSLLAAIMGMAAGFAFFTVGGRQPLGLGLLAAGLAVIAAVLWRLGRSYRHTVYRPSRFGLRDGAVAAAAFLAIAPLLAPWSGLDRSSVFYYPYPALTLPGVDPVIALALGGLAAPALVVAQAAARRRRQERRVPGSGQAP